MASPRSEDNFAYAIAERQGTARKRSVRELVLGRDFELVYERLQRYCIRRLKPREVDLIVLVGAVAAADRLSRRKPARQWERTITLNIPVFDLDFWRDEGLLLSLRETLHYATGDGWHFAFSERRENGEKAFQLPLLEPSASESPVIPFSGGLDSFAMLKAIGDFERSHPVLLCTTSSTKVTAVVSNLARFMGARDRLIEIPFELHGLKHAEPSYRTRPFVFFSLAALASVMMGSRCVFIGENGQGALGPSLVTWSDEHPYQGTHPGFTSRLAEVLSEVFEGPIQFEHPYVWMTKGEMLSRVASKHGLEGIELTHSCSIDTTWSKGSGHPRLCGACSGCILRRLSFYGLPAPHGPLQERYLWDDLLAQSLEASSRGTCVPTENDHRIARAAILNHRHLAEKADAPPGDPALNRVAFEIGEARGIPAGDAFVALRRLLSAHRDEWRRFVDSLGAQSWVSNLGAVSP
jgi:7-cyano-7-deazaguanine synthase in queuosine biosynthesis